MEKANLKLELVPGFVEPHGYELDATIKYIIDIPEEFEYQLAIYSAIMEFGPPKAMFDYRTWLINNGFSTIEPNPTNKFVAQFYGKKPLWKTNYSQGIVVRATNEEDYYIVIECSRLNIGYQYTRILATLGGCL